jgi:hypothetical protein
MRLDAANAQLRLIAPAIVESGIGYQKSNFTKLLRSTGCAIFKSRVESLLESKIETSETCNTIIALQTEIMSNLFSSFISKEIFEFNISAVSEILKLDVHRLKMYKENLYSIIGTTNLT